MLHVFQGRGNEIGMTLFPDSGMAHDTADAGGTNLLKRLWPWAVSSLGIVLILIGGALIGAYVFEAVVARVNEPDQSLLFWYLPILFLGFLGLAAGVSASAWGFRRLKKAVAARSKHSRRTFGKNRNRT